MATDKANNTDRAYRLATPFALYLQANYDIQDSYKDNEKTPRVVILHSGKQYRVLPFLGRVGRLPVLYRSFISHFIAIGDDIPEDGIDVEIKDIAWWRYDTEMQLEKMEKPNET